MNLESYLEKNIITFLEKKDVERKQKAGEVEEEREQFHMKKDYLGLFNSALQRKDLKSAKGLFEEVQKKFSSAQNAAEKEEFTGLIETMFTKMQEMGSLSESGQHFVEEISNLKKPGEGVPIKVAQEESIIRIRKDISDASKNIAELLQKEDMLGAINIYKRMKERFSEYPDEPKEDKEELFNDVIAAYYNIKKLEKIKMDIVEDKNKNKAAHKNETLSTTKEDTQLITKRIEVSMKKGDLKTAMNEYENLKHLSESFPKQFMEEKKALFSHTLNVYNAIKRQAELLKESPENTQEEPKELSHEEHTNKESTKFILTLKNTLKKALELVKEEKMDEADHAMIDAKHMMNHFPDEKIGDQKRFEHLIEEIEHRINFIKQTPEV